MFSRNPFAYFDNDFGDFGPWTNWGYYRPPPRQQRCVRSADPDEICRRNDQIRQPSWANPFWEFPCPNDEEMPREKTVEEDRDIAPQQGGKCRHKSGYSRIHTNTGVKPRKDEANSDEENAGSSDCKIRQFDVQRQAEDVFLEKEKVCKEEDKQSEVTSPAEALETTNETSAGEKIDEEKMESKDAKRKVNEENAGEDKDLEDERENQETEGKMETEEANRKAVNEENQGEDENLEDEMENQGENIEKKLKLIDEQLKKARELAPKEVLISLRTDKQKLYLTEMLLRCILDLDAIETRGNATVKQRRREVVKEIQSYLDIVENNQEIAMLY